MKRRIFWLLFAVAVPLALVALLPAGMVYAQTIITNGNFLTNADGWTLEGTAQWQSTWSGRIYMPAIGDQIVQEFEIDTTGIYTLSYRCADNSGAYTARSAFRVEDEQYTVAYDTPDCSTDGYEYQTMLLVPGSYTLTLRFNNQGASNDIFIDDVVIEFAETGNDIATGLVNGDARGRAGWQYTNADNYIATKGANEAQANYGAWKIDDTLQDYLTQTVNVDNSGTYTVTFLCQSYRNDYPYNAYISLDAPGQEGDGEQSFSCAARPAWTERELVFEPGDTETAVLRIRYGYGNGTSRGIWIDNIVMTGVVEDQEEEEEEGGWIGELITGTPPYAGGYCVFTVTQSMTETGTITETTVYTRPANLLANWSFETQAGAYPASWGTVINGAVQDVPGLWWINSAVYANTGARAIANVADYQAVQDMPLFSAGNYVAGFYARCADDNCDPVQARWNNTVVAASLSMTNTYQVYSGTYTTGGGSAWFAIEMSLGGNAYVDDVFAWPDDGTGNPLCDPSYYAPPGGDVGGDAPPNCVIDPSTNQCIYVPPGPAGATCYYCALPGASSPVQIWLAWLGCVIRNLFSCSLRVWLFEITNGLRGIMASIYMAVNWLNAWAQDGIDYGAAQFDAALNFALDMYTEYGAYLAAAPRQVVVIVQTTVTTIDEGIDWLELIVQLIQLLFDVFVTLLGALYDGLTGLLNMIVYGAKSLYVALTAPGFDLQTDFVDEGLGPGASQGIPAAASTSGGIARLIMALAVIDVSLSDYHAWPVLYTVAGIVGLTTIIWVLKEWKDDIFPI